MQNRNLFLDFTGIYSKEEIEKLPQTVHLDLTDISGTDMYYTGGGKRAEEKIESFWCVGYSFS